MRGKEVVVNDKMQKGYRYVLTKPMGRGSIRNSRRS